MRWYDDAMPSPFASHADTALTYSIVNDVYRVLATARDTGGALGLVDAIVPPGGGPPPHVHTREDEFFYILDGEVTFYLDRSGTASPLVARRGTFLFAPRNQKHTFRNESDKPARMLFGVLPGGMEGLFKDAGRTLASGSVAAVPMTEQDLGNLGRVAAEKYGCMIDAPPATT